MADIDDAFETAAKNKGKTIQFWAFTWNEPKPEQAILQQFLEERGDWRFVYQEEKGHTTERSHFQGRLNLTKKHRCVKNTLMDIFRAGGFTDEQIQQFTPSPESNNGVKQDAVAFYCTKVDTRQAGPWCDPGYTFPVKKRKYEGEDLACMENPTGWQKQVIGMSEEPGEDRKVNWVGNLKGCGGKSKLQKHLCWKGIAKRIPMGLAHQIKNSIATTKPQQNCFVLNIPRVSGKEEQQQELFSAIEEIKDGWVSAVMYGEEKEYFFKPPQVWIFSNSMPNRKLASPDRWQIWQLDSLHQAKLKPYVYPKSQAKLKL